LVAIQRFSDSGGLVLHFYRLPPDNWANGGSINIYVSRQVVAQFLNEVGFACYSTGDFGTALQVFHQAVETDPGHVKAMYNAACSAALLGETALSLEYLAMLKADGSRAALDYLAKVDSDTDFSPIRSQSVFQSELRKIRGSGK
jgi:hypothetical protein